MHHFDYQAGELCCEQVPLRVIAEATGTPCYVYSHATLRRHYRVFDEALGDLRHLICFSAKANSNGAVLAALGRLGAGVDIVSGGELERALRAGIPAHKIVFSGVGKQAGEVAQALSAEILLLNVESEAELELIAGVAATLRRRAPVALRVNPDVDPQTHPYIATGLRESKFGIPIADARRVYERALALPQLDVCGLDCHIGSQLTSVQPLVDSLGALVELIDVLRARGVHLRYLDIGGGLGIRYADESPPTPDEYGAAVRALLRRLAAPELTVICEPGRVIVGNAGVLLTRVVYYKDSGHKRFLIVDAAMNDLLRPSLYGAFHEIKLAALADGANRPHGPVDVVGPICESGDFLAKDRDLPAVEPGALLAIMSAGAYGFSMASSYNSRPRPAEVMVDAEAWAVVRERETVDDLMRGERLPPWLR
ncbi:MAG: diaminopimelate decarboxylase [Proteobacteria bacterium]|nr:diaminopimelate decarboxylase [Pseudomonadota bacterium]